MPTLPLGLHFLNEGFDTMGAMLGKVQMASVKFAEMDLDWLRDPAKIALLDLAKAKGCLVVGRRVSHNPNIDRPDGDMTLEAQDWINGNNGWGGSSLLKMALAFPQVDVWEGPNEIDIKPDQPGRMKKYAMFCYEYARLMSVSARRRVAVGGWAVGTPDISLWQYWGPVLAAVKSFNGFLSRHVYGPIAGDEGTWYAYRYRRDQAEFDKQGFPKVPLLITECGADRLGTFPGPWRKVWGSSDQAIDRYWGDYLKPFTQELMKDSYVFGAHLFTCGNGGGQQWNVFDVAHTDLAGAILRNPITPPAPPPPAPPAWATHQVTAAALNVREFPWTGQATPPVVGQFTQGKYVKSYGVIKLDGMTTGWHLVGADGNMWVNGLYLKPVS